MNRRDFIQQTAVTAGILGALPFLANAGVDEQESAQGAEKLQVTIVIANNHGHDLVLNEVELIKQLRASEKTGSVTLTLIGSHTHPLVLTRENLLQVLEQGEVTADTGGSHVHAVTVKLEIINTTR